MSRDTGLEVLQAFYVELLGLSAQMAAPYVPQAYGEAIVRDGIKRGLDPNHKLALEVLAKLMDTSKATCQRVPSPQNVDQYSVLEKLADSLCPRYPEWTSAADILRDIAEHEPELCLKRLIEILDHFVRMNIFEVQEGKYRLNKSYVWVDQQFIRRDRRARRFAPVILSILDGYIKGYPDCEFGTIELWATEEEFRALILELKAFINEWVARHSAPMRRDSEPPFVVSIISGKRMTRSAVPTSTEGSRASSNGTEFHEQQADFPQTVGPLEGAVQVPHGRP